MRRVVSKLEKKEARPLTKKEAGFVADYLKTGNGTVAALRNYDTKDENVAGVIAYENLRKPKISERIKSFADRIPDDLLEKRHLELLNVPHKIRTYRKGELVTEVEELDVQALAKGLDMAYRIRGFYKNEPEDKDTGVDPTLASINTLINMMNEGRRTATNLRSNNNGVDGIEKDVVCAV